MSFLGRIVCLGWALCLIGGWVGVAGAGPGARDLWFDGAKNLRGGLPEQAVVFFNRALSSADLDSATRIFVLYDRGEAFEKLGQLDRALADFGAVAAASHNHVGARLAQARVYEAKGDLPRARELLKQALKIKPKGYHIYTRRGHVWLKEKQYKKAAWDFQKALELRPESREAHFGLALAYEKLGRLWKAFDHAKYASRPNPGPEHLELLERLQGKLVAHSVKRPESE